MSFSSEVKKEMAAAQPDKPLLPGGPIIRYAGDGACLFPRRYLPADGKNPAVAQGYASLLHEVCAVPEPEVQRPVKKSGFYIVTVRHAEDRLRVMERFGHGPGELNLRLNRANLDCEGCAAAYLRGAFLSCGAVTNPAADYHLEFSVPYRHLSRDLSALLRELDFRAGLAERKGCPVVYLKESEQIEDCLTLLGLPPPPWS